MTKDWTFIKDPELRRYVQSQEPDRQELWATLFDADGYTEEQQEIKLDQYRATDAYGEAVAATASIDEDMQEIVDMEDYGAFAERLIRRGEDLKAGREVV